MYRLENGCSAWFVMSSHIEQIIGLTPIYRIISLRSGVGKTSLGTSLVSVLSKKGVRLAVVKQTHEKIIDPLSDSGRYWNAGAESVIVSSPEATMVLREEFTSLREIVLTMKYHPLVIAEGFRGEPVGKAIAIVEESSEINALIREDKGLWYIVSNDVEVVENAKSIGYNALLMDEVESLAGEIYSDAVQLIASRFKGDPDICGVGSWGELAEKILHGLALPYECPYAYPLKVLIDGQIVEMDPKVARIVASILEGFVAGLLGSSARPKKIEISYELGQKQ